MFKQFKKTLLVLFIVSVSHYSFAYSKKPIEVRESTCFNETCYNNLSDIDNSPLVNCSYLSEKFLDCETLKKNSSNTCKLGMTKYGDVAFTNITCRVFDYIECRGEREFKKEVPCIIYTDKYFVSTLLYSIFLGIFAVDRCCIGNTGIGIGKLITLGGFGIWYIIDIILLVLDIIKPSDGSNWVPFY